jgi:hypothetical protein
MSLTVCCLSVGTISNSVGSSPDAAGDYQFRRKLDEKLDS